ncbi:hypothetical protein OGAPHI_002509 [Ogataea philodendri]|uniref:Uncharacterized protein n=1 Tax=Ogataea philodendri TaxID=1378263 RepID=A0A9P8PC50_9ASCO|nr:uncharacterized protein OGAPHI_002509 [Ogataea philodendri]KAH3668754.1 hypothetical protein OGAPHI_002509 [Ogataea philodendri]
MFKFVRLLTFLQDLHQLNKNIHGLCPVLHLKMFQVQASVLESENQVQLSLRILVRTGTFTTVLHVVVVPQLHQFCWHWSTNNSCRLHFDVPWNSRHGHCNALFLNQLFQSWLVIVLVSKRTDLPDRQWSSMYTSLLSEATRVLPVDMNEDIDSKDEEFLSLFLILSLDVWFGTGSEMSTDALELLEEPPMKDFLKLLRLSLRDEGADDRVGSSREASDLSEMECLNLKKEDFFFSSGEADWSSGSNSGTTSFSAFSFCSLSSLLTAPAILCAMDLRLDPVDLVETDEMLASDKVERR